MDILILGGSVFLGRALVAAALERGHRLTLFNRGKSNPGVYPEVEELHGDRKVDLSLLQGRRWEAAIDTCGYLPGVVRQSAQILAGAVEHYTFVSTLSVYADASQKGIDESAPVGVLEDESVEEITGGTYGPLKALCEQAAEAALPGRVLVTRPGLIVGPHDPTDRFTYWPWRVSQGGEVLAPGKAERGIQFIDVRDLAEWTIRMVEERQTGVFNANGPLQPVAMGDFLEACRAVSGSRAEFTWVGETFLAEQEVAPWMELPLWVPESDPESAGFFTFDSSKAINAGLTFRDMEDTIAATLRWADTRPAEHAWRAGISRQREAELLSRWAERQS